MMNIKKENLYDAFMSGAVEVMDNRLHLNEINVFPVADSDTGSNLYNMMNHIVLNAKLKASVKETLESIADSAIVGARGNSGLIFAQYFHGISMVTNEYNDITANDFVSAAHLGFIHAYKAVEEPVEGTILTTMRIFYEALSTGIGEASSFQELLENAYISVEKAVLKTTEQLINLKKASVVDSGAKGFAYFLKGFINGIKGNYDREKIALNTEDEILYDLEFHNSFEAHDINQEIKYRYCTEALMQGKTIESQFLKKSLSKYGDSIVISGGDIKKRIHIHCNSPWQVFSFLSESQELISTKVDDMKWQYNLRHNRLYDRVILTDSIADIPKETLDKEQVSVINLDILLDKEPHIDKLSLDNDYLFEWIEKNKLQPTSSQAQLEKIEKRLSILLRYYKEVIIVSVSRELSGTYDVFMKASKSFDNKVRLINSKQNSVGQGLILLNAIENIALNKSSDEIVIELKKSVEKTKILVSISTLDPMIASGRISSTLGKIAKVIKLKPIVTLDDDGKGAIEQITFARKYSTKKIINHLLKVHKEKGIARYALTYVDDENLAKKLAGEIEKKLGFSCVYIVKSSSIIAAGAGKGAVALAYTVR